MLARSLFASGAHGEAAEQALAVAFASEEHSSEALRIRMRALRANPLLFREIPRDLATGEFERAVEMDSGSSVMLQLRFAHEARAVFKPEQTVRHTSYRGEIATARLCALLDCAVTVPVNEEVRVHADVLSELLGEDARARRALRRPNSRVIWREEADGFWLYGTLKPWLRHFRRFPIENIDLWTHLVDGRHTPDALRRMSPRSALADLEEADPSGFSSLLRRMTELSAFDIAHQLSELHVLDHLSNNWDRYQLENHGLNCHWNDGAFVALDNGATFQTHDTHSDLATRSRLSRVRYFSRRTIALLRSMDEEWTREFLFSADPQYDDTQRFDDFLERRAWLLARVDSLIDEFGESDVLVFE